MSTQRTLPDGTLVGVYSEARSTTPELLNTICLVAIGGGGVGGSIGSIKFETFLGDNTPALLTKNDGTRTSAISITIPATATSLPVILANLGYKMDPMTVKCKLSYPSPGTGSIYANAGGSLDGSAGTSGYGYRNNDPAYAPNANTTTNINPGGLLVLGRN